MEPIDSPGLLINKLAHAITVDLDRRLRAYDVTISQWGVLKQLGKQGGRSQAELQELLGLEKATVNGLVQRMLRAGLIRSEPDPVDKRVQRLYLTERGRDIKQRTASLEDEVNARIAEGFTGDERAFFVRLLTRALQNLA